MPKNSASATVTTKCPACGSSTIIPNVEVSGDSILRRVALSEQHQAMPSDPRMEDSLKADLCGECGHISLRAANPAKPLDQYVKFTQGR